MGLSYTGIEVRASKCPEDLTKLGIVELVHGFSVKIATSQLLKGKYGSWLPSGVSAFEGKIWVMAAKLKDEKGTSKFKGEGFEPRNLVCMSLINCYVVDCNGFI